MKEIKTVFWATAYDDGKNMVLSSGEDNIKEEDIKGYFRFMGVRPQRVPYAIKRFKAGRAYRYTDPEGDLCILAPMKKEA